MSDKREMVGVYPTLPTARSDPKHTIPISTLQTLANWHAQILWGTNIAGGPAIPVSNADGNLIAYAFPYIRHAQGPLRFPERKQLFRAIEKIRSEHKHASSAGVARRKLSTQFHSTLAQRLGQFGSVYVSATRDLFPVFRASHFLHPYFLNGQEAQEEAGRYFRGKPVKLESLCFLGPHREYFVFSSQGDRLFIHVDSLSTQKPEGVLVDRLYCTASAEVESTVMDAWNKVSKATTEGLPEIALFCDEKIIPRHELIPVIAWTYWCAPSAKTMVLGFWDLMGFGRLIDYWLDHPNTQHPTYGNNIPNLMLKLIDTDTGTWAQGWKDTIDSEAGCHFAFQSIEGTSNNDWAWDELKAEIDSGRPVHWEIFDPGHAMAAFGYRITPAGKFVIVYNAGSPFVIAQREEWHYAAYNGTPAWKTYVNAIVPQEVGSQDNLALVSPNGGEIVFQGLPNEIRWFIWGNGIKKVDVLFSTDGGNTWSLITSGVSTSPSGNSLVWHPSIATNRARIRLKGYSTNGDYIAGDGSRDNFTVISGSIQQIAGRVRFLKLDTSEADSGSPGEPSHAEVIVALDSEPNRTLHLWLRYGLLSPVREGILSVLQEAFNHNHSIVVDYIHTESLNDTIIRAWITKEV